MCETPDSSSNVSDSTTTQYSEASLHRYEVVFGQDFVSSGGIETTAFYCALLGLEAGTRVVDVGSGLGGSAFHMSATYGAHVTGIDILHRMVDMATYRVKSRGVENVAFIQGDVMEIDLGAGSCDLVYSRDSLLHIDDKETLFRKFFDWIAPGGNLFITDYAMGAGNLSQSFLDYKSASKYFLMPVAEYGNLLEEAGFVDIQAIDETGRFVEILHADLAKLRGPEIAEEMAQEDIDYLIERWEMKVAFCAGNDMKWGRYQARRP